MLPELDVQLDPRDAYALRAVLGSLSQHAHRVLGERLVGVYLKGSFALGAGDAHADVDFLIVTNGPLSRGQEEAVREVHRRLPDRAEHWAHVLEGSYAELADLRERADSDKPWLYVDNGQREMELSAHDNTEVFRWVLKNRALAVAGPDASSLLPHVPPQAIRDESARQATNRRVDALADPEYLENGWGQPHEVLTNCRMLYTASTGEVTSKSASGRWCLTVLPTEWHRLVEAAIASRPNPWQRVHRSADPRWPALTAQFIEYMTSRIAEAAVAPLSTPA